MILEGREAMSCEFALTAHGFVILSFGQATKMSKDTQ